MVDQEVIRKLAAILAADVVGYSRLMGAAEEETARTLHRYRAVVDGRIAARGGRVFGSAGDSVIAEFASPVEAVRAAVEIQAEIEKRNADVPEDRRMQFRIGVNLGDVLVEGDNLLGDGVNVAARLEALAAPGGVCISRPVLDQIEGKLDAAFDDAGSHQVKNIARPIHVWRWRNAEPGAAAPALSEPSHKADKPSIAVLPFDNMSRDPEIEFFGDGIADDIITALSKISSMRVIARNSSFAYKGASPDLRRVADELGVRYVLEGSIRRGGDRLRITAQLIDAGDGSHLWAERFDRVLDDIFDIQDEITKEIVTALRVRLTDGEQALVWARGTDNVEAWQCCVRASELFIRFNTSDYLEARSLAERATELDPNYAHAWAVIGFTHWWDGRLGYTSETEVKFQRANEIADHAMALDDTVSWVIGLRALASAALGRYDEAVAVAERGVAHHPGNADVRAFLAFALWCAGRYPEALDHMRAAMALNPHCPNWYRNALARILISTDQLDEALTMLDRIIATDTSHILAHLNRAVVLVRLDREAEARKSITEVRKIAPHLRTGHVRWLQLSKDETLIADFTDSLRQAGLPD